ncbi:hypothetical protein AGI3411_02695 [Achromobacter agilis]|uniref:Uncharacterized protein n=1 Tax=Achromobacter agilis TaxID=1353888 RepID=A0A446CFS8_9BURK|nr:nucleotidyl transferase AbiEii/AbiGii toxin family protein [Achromobacter agilis]SSW66730.1 hypothetical protein AGI3411_02695 [Achromobacter agilis]
MLKLEIIQRQPLLPCERQRFGYLYETLAGQPLSATVEFDCISIAETLAEKVLSLLRRCADNWDGHQARRNTGAQAKNEMDPTLVRHIYDVARIADAVPESVATACAIFAQLVEQDRREFEGQNPEFDTAPVGVLKRTLDAARSNAWLRQQYDKVLLPLVCDNDPPGFDESFVAFEKVALSLIATCEGRPS